MNKEKTLALLGIYASGESGDPKLTAEAHEAIAAIKKHDDSSVARRFLTPEDVAELEKE